MCLHYDTLYHIVMLLRTASQQMMDLRAAQTALFAGRAASRWATTSTTLNSTALFARHISSTRARTQEAQAFAPEAPSPSSTPTNTSPSMYDHIQRRLQQQPQATPQEGQQPQQQQQVDSLRSLLSSSSPSSSSSSSVPAIQETNKSQNLTAWAKPSAGLARAQRKTTDVIASLGFGYLDDLSRPSAEDLTRTRDTTTQPLPEDIKLRLRPVLGRSVKIGDQTDLAYGLKILGTKCTSNRVAADSRAQRFHERPGLKRKRLKSQRWRARFRNGFQATCQRVTELAKQGW